MQVTTSILPRLLSAVSAVIDQNADNLTALDQAIGDGDHVTNIQRGIHALVMQSDGLSHLDWSQAFQKMGLTIMSSVGGASGSLYGTLFVTMAKAVNGQDITKASFPEVFYQGVEAVKHRGKAEKGEKTMLDVLIPVAEVLKQSFDKPDCLAIIKNTAAAGAEATRDMLATKGRASYLGERSLGHVDAGARSSQLMICAIADALSVAFVNN